MPIETNMERKTERFSRRSGLSFDRNPYFLTRERVSNDGLREFVISLNIHQRIERFDLAKPPFQVGTTEPLEKEGEHIERFQ